MKSLISYVATKTKVINGKYHRFLERNFPRFYLLYTTFTKGKNRAETGPGRIGDARGCERDNLQVLLWERELGCLRFHKCLSIKLNVIS